MAQALLFLCNYQLFTNFLPTFYQLVINFSSTGLSTFYQLFINLLSTFDQLVHQLFHQLFINFFIKSTFSFL